MGCQALNRRFVIFVLAAALCGFAFEARGQTFVATTTVNISVCGNGIVEAPTEVCDDGRNLGVYSTSTAGRSCKPDCSGYAAYCGDGILQAVYGEQCDDGNNSAGDGCSATCQIESGFSPAGGQGGPTTGGGGGGGGGSFPGGSNTPPPVTQVVVQGKAYPGANVNILQDGAVVGIVQADTSANFYFSTKNVTPGVTTFGFWAEDSNGLKSIALTTTFTVTANAVTTVSGEYLPPTIDIDKRQLKKGDTLTISGQSVPSVNIETHINSDSEIVETTSTDARGNWQIAFDTSPLAEEDFHTVKALFTIPTTGGATSKSTFSQSLSFYVGTKNIGKSFLADLNHDGKVNLADFSILLFYWNTSTPLADINGDGIVDLKDFSIMLFDWTG